MEINNFFRLFAAIALAECAGIIGAIFTRPAIAGWYASLQKPLLNPPAWIFGPVWILLYALMGIALFLVWKNKTGPAKRHAKAVGIFFVQLALNFLWSIIFFGLRNPGAAFIEIIILWTTIIVTIALFHKISKLAAWLLVPYILWVSFAGYLNFAIWMIN